MKYDKPYEFHITLKQPCYIEEDKIPKLKDKLSNFFKTINLSKQHTLKVIFDNVLLNKDEDGMTIMLKTSHDELIHMQRILHLHLEEYKNYLKPKYKIYEEDFIPHITIGRNLSEIQEKEARQYLQNDFDCTGEINSIVLSIVNNNTPEEAKNPENQNLYYL